MTTCPSTEQLTAFVNGSLPESDQLTTQEHVDDCTTCQLTLESLVAGSESWDSALGHLRDAPVGNRETVLSDAMQRMKAEEFVESADQNLTSKDSLDFLAPSNQPGSIGKLGPYEVTEVVGQGGMGIVLKAFDPALHRVVAVKVLAPYLAHNPQARKRFVREAQAIAAVSHDHVITIHAIDESAEQPKIVMQFVAGRSLQQKIDAEGSLELKEILRIGMQTASGLAAAHAQGLVHRDVKPSNILLENGIQRVKLTDFGLARAVDDASLTQSGAIAGTPQYMAPEQANGDAVDYRADLFSLGSVLYAMCVGHSPFRASTTMGVLKRVCHDPPRPIQELNPDIPEWLCAIVMKLLNKKPEDRFESARSVAELLEKWLAHCQQPMVVPKPAVVAVTAAASMQTAKSGSGDQARSHEQFRSARRDLDARTIFFQPISGRWFLFFVLVGMAVTLATIRLENRGGPNFFEGLMISLMAGLFTGLWGLVFVAIFRLVWANLYGYIPWVAKSSKSAVGLEDLNNSVAANQRSWGGFYPESLAMLAAIGTMLISFNPLIAAIVAIIVWHASKQKQTVDVMSSDGSSSEFVNHIPTEQVHRFAWATEFPRRGWDYCRNTLTSLASYVSPSSMESRRLFMAIGWCLVGGIDLLVAMISTQILAPLVVGSLAMSVISFVVCYCIQARQNFGIVRRLSYLGLLPLSLGALGRIPLSIVTLMWQNVPATQESFETTPWPETGLGRLSSGLVWFVRRSFGTLILAGIWTLCWAAIVAAIFWFCVLPYGPSTYEVLDRSTIGIKRQPNARFHLIARGSGNGIGLIPPSNATYGPDEVFLEFAGNQAPNRLKIQLEGTGPFNTTTSQTLTLYDLERCLSDFDGQNHPDHAANLLALIQRMDARILPSAKLIIEPSPQHQSYSERMKTSVELWSRHLNSRMIHHSWPGFTRFGSLLDPELFEIFPDHGLSKYDFYPASWFSLAGGLASTLFWLLICGWIFKRRHFHRAAVKPSPMAA